MTSLQHPTGPTAPLPSVLGHHISHTAIIRQTPKRLSNIQPVQPTQQVQPLRSLAPRLPLHTSTHTQPTSQSRRIGHPPLPEPPIFFGLSSPVILESARLDGGAYAFCSLVAFRLSTALLKPQIILSAGMFVEHLIPNGLHSTTYPFCP
jgi:hypothetical protein